MKKFFLIAAFISLFFLTGCEKDKPIIAFSNKPFDESYSYLKNPIFHAGDRIYYGIYNPKEFKTRLLKLQIIKKESEKSEFWGIEHLRNKTIELKDKHTFQDYIVINNKGFYIFQVFEYTNFQQPIAIGAVKVE